MPRHLRTDEVRQIIEYARAFDVKEGETDPDAGSNAIDDGFTDVLEANDDDSTEQELRAEIDGLNEDQKAELTALAWIGRGDYDPAELDDAIAHARREATTPTARYLMGMPMLGDYLEDGLAAVLDAGLEDED